MPMDVTRLTTTNLQERICNKEFWLSKRVWLLCYAVISAWMNSNLVALTLWTSSPMVSASIGTTESMPLLQTAFFLTCSLGKIGFLLLQLNHPILFRIGSFTLTFRAEVLVPLPPSMAVYRCSFCSRTRTWVGSCSVWLIVWWVVLGLFSVAVYGLCFLQLFWAGTGPWIILCGLFLCFLPGLGCGFSFLPLVLWLGLHPFGCPSSLPQLSCECVSAWSGLWVFFFLGSAPLFSFEWFLTNLSKKKKT